MRDLGMPSVPHYERLPPASAAELADLTRTLETDGALEGGYISLETARLLESETLIYSRFDFGLPLK